jgi:ankyrin repeat protein
MVKSMKQCLIFCAIFAFLTAPCFLQSMEQPHYSPLVQALLARWDDEACRLIQMKKTNVNEIDYENGASLLMLACYAGLHDVTQAMLNRSDILVNCQDYIGTTALMYAIRGGHVGIVTQLLRHPEIDRNQAPDIAQLIQTDDTININMVDSTQYSLLMAFSFAGWDEVVQKLIEQPLILVNAQDKLGSTALMYAVRGMQLEAIKLLLACTKIDISLTDISGHTALYWANQSCNSEIIALLKEAEAKASSWLGYCAIS